MATKYSKSTLWLKQFIDLCDGLLPVDRILAVRAYYVPTEKRMLTDACLLWDRGGWYNVTISLEKAKWKTLGNKKFLKEKHTEARLGFILDSLAHELAHIKIKDHHPDHLILQSKILLRFAKHLKKLGIKDTSKPYGKEIDTEVESGQ